MTQFASRFGKRLIFNTNSAKKLAYQYESIMYTNANILNSSVTQSSKVKYPTPLYLTAGGWHEQHIKKELDTTFDENKMVEKLIYYLDLHYLEWKKKK